MGFGSLISKFVHIWIR